MYMGVHVCGGQRSPLGLFPSSLSTLDFETESLSLKFIDWLEGLDSKPSDILLVNSQCWGHRYVLTLLFFPGILEICIKVLLFVQQVLCPLSHLYSPTHSLFDNPFLGL